MCYQNLLTNCINNFLILNAEINFTTLPKLINVQNSDQGVTEVFKTLAHLQLGYTAMASKLKRSNSNIYFHIFRFILVFVFSSALFSFHHHYIYILMWKQDATWIARNRKLFISLQNERQMHILNRTFLRTYLCN